MIIVGDFNSNSLDCFSSTDINLLGNVNLTRLIDEPTREGYRSSSLFGVDTCHQC